jgi:hypothetical protein
MVQILPTDIASLMSLSRVARGGCYAAPIKKIGYSDEMGDKLTTDSSGALRANEIEK